MAPLHHFRSRGATVLLPLTAFLKSNGFICLFGFFPPSPNVFQFCGAWLNYTTFMSHFIAGGGKSGLCLWVLSRHCSFGARLHWWARQRRARWRTEEQIGESGKALAWAERGKLNSHAICASSFNLYAIFIDPNFIELITPNYCT